MSWFTSLATRSLVQLSQALSVPDEFQDRRSIGNADKVFSMYSTAGNLQRGEGSVRDNNFHALNVGDGTLELHLVEYSVGPVYYELQIQLKRPGFANEEWLIELPNGKPRSHALILQRIVDSWNLKSSSDAVVKLDDLSTKKGWKEVVLHLESQGWAEE